MTSLHDPRRPHPGRALTDGDSAQVLTDASDQLIMLRSPMRHGDAMAELHALASLITEANSRLPRVIADARDQQHSWSEIAGQLGQPRLAVIARHAGRTAKRRTPLDPN